MSTFAFSWEVFSSSLKSHLYHCEAHREVVPLVICVQGHLNEVSGCIIEGVPWAQVGPATREQQAIDGFEPAASVITSVGSD
jgi:hypothetical protein